MNGKQRLDTQQHHHPGRQLGKGAREGGADDGGAVGGTAGSQHIIPTGQCTMLLLLLLPTWMMVLLGVEALLAVHDGRVPAGGGVGWGV